MQPERKTRRTWRGLQAAALLAIVAALVALPVASEASASPSTSPIAAQAVGLAVAHLGDTYAGDCAATRSPEDAGKICSKFVAEQSSDLRAYLIGPTFSEFTQWVFIEQTADGWTSLGALPYDDTAGAVPWPVL